MNTTFNQPVKTIISLPTIFVKMRYKNELYFFCIKLIFYLVINCKQYIMQYVLLKM